MSDQTNAPQLTMNSDGTLSLSIEETNALRISLGLKPLNTETTETKISEKEIHKPAQKIVNVDDIKGRIEKAKWLRKERELKRTKTLGESSDDDSDNDAASFVEKSRKLEKEKKLAEEKMKKLEQEEAEREQNVDLSGVTIALDEDLISDEPIILTLADKDFMDEGDDELENVNLREEEKRIYNKKQEQRSLSYNVYEAIDNPEFNLLNQYDNKTFDESKKKFKLNEMKTNSSKLENKINDPTKMVYDLDDEKKFMSEYKSEKVKVKKRKIKDKKIRTVSVDDFDAEDSIEDHGSRRSRNTDETNEEKNQSEREIGYQKAMEKAEMKSKFLLKNHQDEIDEKFERKNQNINQFKDFDISQKTKEITQQELEKEQYSNVKFLNPTEEFVKSIKMEEKIEVKKPKIKRERMEIEQEEEVLNVKIPAVKKEEDVFDEPIVASGLAATLQFADQYLEKSESTPKSKRIKYNKSELNYEELPEIKIERKDRFGQVMNEKKAWKQMTQKFHNKMPGKNKLEKERKQFEQKQKIKNMSITDTPLKSVETLQKIQKQTGQAYIEFGKSGSMKTKENQNSE